MFVLGLLLLYLFWVYYLAQTLRGGKSLSIDMFWGLSFSNSIIFDIFSFLFFFFPMARKIGDRYFPLAKCFMNHNIWEAQPQGILSTVTYLCKFTWSGSFPFLSVRTKPGSKRIPWLRVSPITLWRLSFLFSNIVIVTSWKAVTNERHNLYLLLVFYFTFQSSSHSLWLISLSI